VTAHSLQEARDRLIEFEAVLLEEHEMRRVLDEDVFLNRRVGEVAHQPFAILLEGPGIEIAADDERRNIDRRRVPHAPPGRLHEAVLEHAVGRA
jgi:hypothetical protein